MGSSLLHPAAAARSRPRSFWACCCLCSCCQLQDGAALHSIGIVCFRSGSCIPCCSPLWACQLKLPWQAVLHCTSVWRLWCPASTPTHCLNARWLYEHRCGLGNALQAPAVARSLMMLCCSVLLLYGCSELVPSSRRNEHNVCKEKLGSQLNQLAVRDGRGRNVLQMPVLLQWCWRYRRNELKAASEQCFHS